MKQSDKIAIILIGMVGIGVSWVGVNQLLGNPDDASVSFKTIEVIDADLDIPDPDVFNKDAINPTVEVYIGSCEDADGDGVLSQAERAACGQAKTDDDEDDSGNNPTPVPTGAPVPTLAPTISPVPSGTPEPTGTPGPTEALVPTDEPEPTDEPVPEE
ncbi:MAG: hypothetical protein Q4F60_02915 [Candidatus Saccharibacteria bacterium]|nr:hypothetical protein [Candidatus Saccharibacteria bacterium]